MQIVSRKTLVAFWERHPQAKAPLETWYSMASKVEFPNWQHIQDVFGTTVDRVADNRVIFDIGGNKYRLIVHVSFTYKSMLVKFVGTHKDYYRIDPETV
jgi:mRNA interferase HigB